MNSYLTDDERPLLERAVVGIAGCGGLGSNCAMHLVRAGVKRLILADFDEVSASNLNRQFFFRDQLGRKKTAALADNLKRINPELDLSLFDGRLDAASATTLFKDAAIVVEAFDAAEAKLMLLKAFPDKPVVSASGLAGWGRSNDLKVQRVGKNLVLIGDGTSDVSQGLAPQSARTGIAAAMEANTVLALLLGKPL